MRRGNTLEKKIDVSQFSRFLFIINYLARKIALDYASTKKNRHYRPTYQ